MREYIITVAVAALTASVLELFAPKEWEKYVKLAIGFVILSVIITPIISFRKTEIPHINSSKEVKEEIFYDEISKQLKENVEKDIELRMADEFGTEVRCEVEIEVDENHNIKGVKKITLYTKKEDALMAERLKEVYGCERIETKF